MVSVLSSWKDIANYLGKGVRTVQRWEKELGLPVRRPEGQNHGTVITTVEDINNWLKLKSIPKRSLYSELESLRVEVQEPKRENRQLREQLQRIDTFTKTA